MFKMAKGKTKHESNTKYHGLWIAKRKGCYEAVDQRIA